ncbi:conserved hypothetical protein [Gloeothece citriformis PCC 7424]|uniref:Uncharacterized protein n=1 Tax=Gloeothece citriformis (strain PCC 7424) TaxID=65393 RepID=B7KK95_GLOC7|nr:hypothetical protein [Gloeothece citriformis]ACK70980.1 conserved hypothetical protein [Gloeothece citriformis PCC 7424]
MIEFLLVGLSLLIFVSLFYFLVKFQQEIQKQNLKTNKSLYWRSSPNFSQKSQPKNIHLESKLLQMVGGKRDIAQRLVDNIKRKNPRRNEKWCWEKAIYDLERDRQ